MSQAGEPRAALVTGEVTEALRRAPLFADLPPPMLDDLVTAGRTVDVSQGTALIEEGSAPEAMYLVLDGELEVSKHVSGADVVVNRCGPGDIVGELGLLHGRARSATLRATTPVRALRFGAEAVDRLLSHPASARRLLGTTAARADRDEALLQQHQQMATLGRLAAGLLHDLNNPASAVQRGAVRLRDLLAGSDQGSLAALRESAPVPDDPLERADVQDALAAVLRGAGVDREWELAGPLATAGVDPARLRSALEELPPSGRAVAVEELTRSGELAALLEEVEAGARTISRLVAATRALAYQSDHSFGDVDLHAELELAMTLLRHKVPPRVSVVRDLDARAQVVQGWAADLASVWINLVGNALDAVGDDGTVRLRTRGRPDDVTVDVENTGPPVPEDVLAHAFEPFFTTKPVGKGSGIGLATAFRIVVTQHRGSIALTHSDGVTRARVVLPRRQPATPSG